MEAMERVKLARYFNARGIRMMKCAGHVESCPHHKAFKELAEKKFGERDRLMEQARVELGKRKMFLYQIETLGFEPGGYAEVLAVDELEAGSKFESECERLGLDAGIYRVLLVCRVRP